MVRTKVSAFGRLASRDFWRLFGAVNGLGERRREKTRNEGESLRGVVTDFAHFLGISDAKVRIFGSVARLRCLDRPKDCPVETDRGWNGEGIRDFGKLGRAVHELCWKFRQR